MKASEAIAILESLDPSYEVTLTLGTNQPKRLPDIPKWNGTPMYPPRFDHNSWPTQTPIPPYTITCH